MMSIPAPEAFGIIALRVAPSGFQFANIQQPGDTGRLRVARGIAARGRVSRVYSRSMAVRKGVSGMLESSIVFIAIRGRVSGMHESKITARGRSGGRVTINTVFGGYARSTSPYRRHGQCVW